MAEAPPPGASVAARAVRVAGNVAGKLYRSYSHEWWRAAPDVQYTTLEDFRRCDPSPKRMVVIGCTGAGKSTLLNIMGGWNYVQRPPDYEFEWENCDGSAAPPPPFASSASTGSMTRSTSFANLSWFGSEDRPIVAIDTPGHDDSETANIEQQASRNKLAQLATDLHNKIKAMGHVHLILVLHNDVISNRLNPATFTLLRMVEEKFSSAEQNVWQNVAIAYSKCNDHDTSWRAGLLEKKRQLRAAIQAAIPSCRVPVPILCLGGGSQRGLTQTISGSSAKFGESPIQRTPRKGVIGEEIIDRRRSRSRSLRRVSMGSAASPLAAGGAEFSQESTGDFEVLWELLQNAAPLDTSKLQPFVGPYARWQILVEQRDEAEFRAKAARIYVGVLFRLIVLLLVLGCRAWMLPEIVSRWCLLNISGPWDEMIFVAFLAYWIGPSDVIYSCRHFYDVWLRPYCPGKRD